MKELSIEEKIKAYDGLIERLKDLKFAYRFTSLSDTIEEIFPELKEENEDERIRKELIDFVKSRLAGFPQCEKFIAWLEKQDSHYTFEIKEGHWYKCVCDYMLNGSNLMFKNDRLYYCRRDWRLRGEIDERNVKDLGVNGYKSFFRPATNQEIKDWLEKQGNNMGISEATKQKLKDNLDNALEKETPESWNEFLEKQGEQNPWSEEDEVIYYGVIETEQYMLDVVNGIKKFDVGNISIKEECTRELNWLKFLKDRIQLK